MCATLLAPPLGMTVSDSCRIHGPVVKQAACSLNLGLFFGPRQVNNESDQPWPEMCLGESRNVVGANSLKV